MKRILILLSIIMIFFAGCSKKETTTMERPDYKKVRIKKIPLAMQCWTFRKFTFFETLAKVEALGIHFIEAYPGQPLDASLPGEIFDHNLKDAQIDLVNKKLKEHNIQLVNYGVVGFENTEEDMRKVFDFARKAGIRTIVTEPKFDDFFLLEKMVKDYGNIKVAIHNHPYPSKYAHPETVFEHIKHRDDRIGACGDTGHWLRTGVNPVEALRMLEGKVHDIHLKDLNKFGERKAHDVPFGSGKANIHDVLAELSRQNYAGYLCVEHENKAEEFAPEASIRKGIDYIKSITYYEDYEEILKRQDDGNYTKHGWNHYGPGYFELDERTGVLTSRKGMGLFWFAGKKYGNFILELDFMVSEEKSNSGIFLRIPTVPFDNYYVGHSFEVQIYAPGSDVHKTGAIYDAEPPKKDAAKGPGEWNHYKISFINDHIDVELNDVRVIDWDAEPRGKIEDFATDGYIGLQNHDWETSVSYRNIFIKEIVAE
ncbi:MAG: DUF1080 domain-containing protein [Candidatus Marinimicrobia bacterium]|nr:DUF1080 domain-containing protein [Candidatus Neomarinimicrobiota bacterium]